MSYQRRAARIMTKSVLLIIFSTVLSVNIAFSEEDVPFPLSMTTQDFIDNCGVLFSSSKNQSKIDEIQSAYCLGFIMGIDTTETFIHGAIAKEYGINRSHKPVLCLPGLRHAKAKEVALFLKQLVKALERRKNPQIDDKGSRDTLYTLLKYFRCDHARRLSKGDNQETDSSDSDFKDVLFEITPISPAKIFRDALETIVRGNYENLSQDEMYKVIYVKGAINSVNESFSKEKNSKCAFIPAKDFALNQLSLIDNDEKQIFKELPFLGNLHLTISLMYKKNCKDDTGGSYDMPKDENELMAGGVEKGKYYSRVTINMFVKIRDEGLAKQFNEGLVKESKFLETVSKKSLKRITTQSIKQITKKISKKDLSNSMYAILLGRLGALWNMECRIDPISSSCFKP